MNEAKGDSGKEPKPNRMTEMEKKTFGESQLAFLWVEGKPNSSSASLAWNFDFYR